MCSAPSLEFTDAAVMFFNADIVDISSPVSPLIQAIDFGGFLSIFYGLSIDSDCSLSC